MLASNPARSEKITTHHGQTPFVMSIVLNWNRTNDTFHCVNSLLKSDFPNLGVTVVDNGSTVDPTHKITSLDPAPNVIRLGVNLGYGGGNNEGIRYAIEAGADYLLILNNDTIVAPNMVSELVRVAEGHQAAGMFGPIVRLLESRDTLFAAGSFIRWNRGQSWHRGMFEPSTQYSFLTEPESVDFLNGSCVMVRRGLVEEVGGLDASYFLNFEDVEWAVRAKSHGFSSVLVPSSSVWHGVSSTQGRDSPSTVYYMTRNALRFFWENGPRRTRWLATLRIMARTIRSTLAWTLKSEYAEEAYSAKQRANLFAVRDFLLGKWGAMGIDVASTLGNT